jgi:hypothetical protein
LLIEDLSNVAAFAENGNAQLAVLNDGSTPAAVW